MNVLAFDTATAATVVALAIGDGAAPRELRHDPAPGERPGHVSQLLALASRLLDEAGLAFSDLDRIGVGVGPGTFTGLRIGVATARALAQGAQAEIVGVSTLEALARNVPRGPVLAVLDARRGEAFVAVYEDGEQRAAPAAVTPQGLADLAQSGHIAVGDGAVRFRAVLEPTGAEVPADGSPLHLVRGLHLVELAVAGPPAGAGVVPEYVRLPDAELAFRRKQPPS
jgi:tRNA threonylcarbamoyladenosine biosynthesis protein TsaB